MTELIRMREIVVNSNSTYTIKFDNWSITANAKELEDTFNICFKSSIIGLIKLATNGR